jgi:hypothetical protein
MASVLNVYKQRMNIVTVSLGMDVSGETFTSQIRTEPDQDAELIAEWAVAFDTNGTDGELILTLTETDVADIELRRGWMDIKRNSSGASLPVFDRPLEVDFIGAVTV